MLASERFDYNLIKTLILVFETKSMGAAAQALGVSAPTLSYSLNKIRQYYNDPLFIKTAHGLKVTPIAQQLYPQYKNIEAEFNRVLTFGEEKKLDVRKVTVRTNTLMEYFFMDKVLKTPGFFDAINFEFNNKRLTEEQRVSTIVSRGVDIDIGHAIRKENSLICTPLARSSYVVMCKNDHPRIGRKLTQEQWLSEDHAIISVVEGGTYWPSSFNELFVQRKIRYITPSLLNIFHCLECSEMITVIPEYFVSKVKQNFPLRSVELPWLQDEYLDIFAYMHSRDKNDGKLKMIISALQEVAPTTKI